MSRDVSLVLIGIGATIIVAILVAVVDVSVLFVVLGFGVAGILVLVGLIGFIRSRKKKEAQTMTNQEGKGQHDIHVTSYGQQGGITAGVVNIQAESPPKVDLSEITHRETSEGHLYEALLTIDTRYPIPQLRVIAHANSIKSLDVAPQASGLFMFGNSGKSEGYHFTTLQNVAGKYKIKVTTAEPEEIKIDLA